MDIIITLASTDWFFGIWLGIFVVALIMEALEPQLVAIWFAGGALVAFILSLFPGVELWVQILVFIITTGILLILSFVFFRKSFLNSKKDNTNLDALVDEEVTLRSRADKENIGEVYYRDVLWKVTPYTATDVFIEGEVAIVVSIKGNRLVIKKKGN